MQQRRKVEAPSRQALVEARVDYEARAQSDPVWWVHEVLGEDRTTEMVLKGEAAEANAPWGKQVEILESVRDNRRTAVKACHNVGKTHISARVGIWFLYSHRPSVVLTTAPKLTQVRDLLWARWRAAWNGSKTELGGECLTLRCRPIPDNPEWFAVGLTARDDVAFGGYHESYVLIILDEAPGVPPIIWEAAEGMLSGENVRVLAIGNPTERSGPFYQACVSDIWNTISISAFDHPNVKHQKLIYTKAVAPGWPEERRREWGETSAMYLSRVAGEFPDEGDDTLIPLAWVEAAVERDASDSGRSAVAVDVARFGSDETVWAKVSGAWAEILDTYQGKDLMTTAGRGRRYAAEADTLLVDDTGLGGGVTDRLRELDENVTPINAGERALHPEDFADLGSEIAWNLREAFRETYELEKAGKDDPTVGISIPNDPILIHQLAARKYDYKSNGQIKVESKDQMRRRGEKSPDRADALGMAWWGKAHRADFAFVSDAESDVQAAREEQEAELAAIAAGERENDLPYEASLDDYDLSRRRRM